MKKKRKSVFDQIFGSFFDEFESFLSIPSIGGQTGYSIEVTWQGDQEIVKVKTFGNVDKVALKNEIRRQYPNAKIVFEGEKEEISLIKEVKENGVKELDRRSEVKKVGSPLIKEVREENLNEDNV